MCSRGCEHAPGVACCACLASVAAPPAELLSNELTVYDILTRQVETLHERPPWLPHLLERLVPREVELVVPWRRQTFGGLTELTHSFDAARLPEHFGVALADHHPHFQLLVLTVEVQQCVQRNLDQHVMLQLTSRGTQVRGDGGRHERVHHVPRAWFGSHAVVATTPSAAAARAAAGPSSGQAEGASKGAALSEGLLLPRHGTRGPLTGYVYDVTRFDDPMVALRSGLDYQAMENWLRTNGHVLFPADGRHPGLPVSVERERRQLTDLEWFALTGLRAHLPGGGRAPLRQLVKATPTGDFRVPVLQSEDGDLDKLVLLQSLREHERALDLHRHHLSLNHDLVVRAWPAGGGAFAGPTRKDGEDQELSVVLRVTFLPVPRVPTYTHAPL